MRSRLARAWTGALLLALAVAPASAETLAALSRATHFHGLAVHPQDSSKLLLATHHGFYTVTRDGNATRVSQRRDDFMGFNAHPSDGGVLLASGHPAQGGNLGVVLSTDGGVTWRQIAAGVNGPVDFHQMDISKLDPRVTYGVYAGSLQVSRDTGRTWRIAGTAPDGIIDLAASATAPRTLYAATRQGLLITRDEGQTWAPAHAARQAATMVETGRDGAVYAFVLASGLMRASDAALTWETLNNGFGERVILHLAIDRQAPQRVYAITQDNRVWASADGGRTWKPLGSS